MTVKSGPGDNDQTIFSDRAWGLPARDQLFVAAMLRRICRPATKEVKMMLSEEEQRDLLPKRRARGRLLALVAAVVCAAGIAGGAMMVNSRPAAAPARNAPAPVPVHVMAARVDDLRHEMRLVGTVLPLKDIVIRSQVDGILGEVLVQEGDVVRTGDLIATIDDRLFRAALQAAQGQLARNRALLKTAERELERSRRLQQQNAIASEIVDQRQGEVEQLRAAVAIDEANVETAQVNLSFTRIFAQADGRVGLRQLDPGNNVREDDTTGIISIVQTDPISVVFSVPQQQLTQLQLHTASIDGTSVAVLDRSIGKEIGRGKIVAFDNRIGGTNGTARVRAQFENVAGILKPGGFVSVSVETGRSEGAIIVPKHAVRLSIDGNFVFRVQGETAERVPVEVGYSNDEVAVITKGVAAGDQIVTDGYSRLRATTLVKVLEGQPQARSNGGAEISS
jgi:RND family efflux transporter MFP subunit